MFLYTTSSFINHVAFVWLTDSGVHSFFSEPFSLFGFFFRFFTDFQSLFFLLFLCKLFFLLIFLVNQQFFFSLIFSSCYSQIDSKIFFGILISHGIIFFIPVSDLFSVEFFESLPLLRFICRLFFYKLRFSIFLFFTGFAFHLSVNSFSI